MHLIVKKGNIQGYYSGVFYGIQVNITPKNAVTVPASQRDRIMEQLQEEGWSIVAVEP